MVVPEEATIFSLMNELVVVVTTKHPESVKFYETQTVRVLKSRL